MIEQSCSPNSSFSPPSKRLFEELFPELSESLEDQFVELAIVLSVQPFLSRPPPTFDTGWSVDLGLKSLENLPATNDQLGLVIFPLNPLFDIVEISPPRPYSPYDQPGVPLELSPRTRSTIRLRLFPKIEPEGDAPVISLKESEVSTPHTVEEEELHFPPEGFPYSGGIRASFPPNYVSLA